MPVEYELLIHDPEPLERCPVCGSTPFRSSHMRGCVQKMGLARWWADLRGQGYCAVICDVCEDIVGHERPSTVFEEMGRACGRRSWWHNLFGRFPTTRGTTDLRAWNR